MIPETPIISIIVPVYNIDAYLPRCLESIINQTFMDFETILVDDGSTDRCGEICDTWANYDKRIKVIHKANGGLSEARNTGIDIARGQYIMFVDGDDYISSELTEKLYKALVSNNADMSICNLVGVDEHGNCGMIECYSLPIKNEVITGRQAIERLSEGKTKGSFVVSVKKLYKVELFSSIRFPVGRIHEDEFIAHHLFGCCNRIACIEDVGYFYYQRQDSITHKRSEQSYFDGIDAYYDRLEYCEKKGYDDLAPHYYYMFAMSVSELFSVVNNINNYQEKLNVIYQKIKTKSYLIGRCTRKEQVHLWLILVSPKFHEFLVQLKNRKGNH